MNIDSWNDKAHSAAEVISAQTGRDHHHVALIAGSGWGNAVEKGLETLAAPGSTIVSVPFKGLDGFTAAGVQGHSGRVMSASIAGIDGEMRNVLVFLGRHHLYERDDVQASVHSVRTAHACGVGTLILTNGAGSVRPEWSPGTMVIIKDHINLSGATPLVGATFIDMSTTYTPRLRELALSMRPQAPEGVYAQMHGPAYETPAEIRMLDAIGADLAGMSTAVEAIQARALGMDILGISLVTNLAAGLNPEGLDHAEVISAGAEHAQDVADFLTLLLPHLG